MKKLKVTVIIEATANIDKQLLEDMAQGLLDDVGALTEEGIQVVGQYAVRQLDQYGATAGCNCQSCVDHRKQKAAQWN